MKRNNIANNIILLLVLVFIQISCEKKEELSSFSIMNSKIEESIENAAIINSTLLDVIYNKAKNDDEFIKYKETADKVHQISKIFNDYLEDLKGVVKEKKSTEFVDEYFFNGQEIARGGEEFLNYIENYKSSMISTLNLSNPDIAGMVKSTFDIGSIEDRKGKQTDWLTLNYKGFPAIASVIKMSEMQANVKQIEKTYHESVLNVKLKQTKGEQELIDQRNAVASNTNSSVDVAVNDVTTTTTEEPVKTEEETPEVKEAPKKETPAKETQTETEDTSAATVHVVKKGETIYMISKKYGITTSNLKKMNGLTNNNLVIGQKLKVK